MANFGHILEENAVLKMQNPGMEFKAINKATNWATQRSYLEGCLEAVDTMGHEVEAAAVAEEKVGVEAVAIKINERSYLEGRLEAVDIMGHGAAATEEDEARVEAVGH
ncbi:hypothetical protein Q3G72_014856 [Acer saccharum]|nr:hypothetical protein Q3G72_014856 [Acer saccharum]